MFRIFVFVLVLGLPLWGTAAKYEMNENCLNAYDLILNLRFSEAEKILRTEKALNPGNNIVPYLENYQWFLKVIISEEEKVFSSEKIQRELRQKLYEKGEQRSPWHLYCQAQLNLQWAFARIKFGEYTFAAIELNRSYRQLVRNQELFPEFLPNKAALGLLHMLIGSIPDNYKWVANTLSVKGTINQGLGEIRQVILRPEVHTLYPFLRTEGLFMLTFVTFNLASIPEHTEFLDQQFLSPDVKTLIKLNPLLTYAASSYYLHSGSNDKAIEFLLNRPRGNQFFPFHYLDYLTGVALLNRLDPEARLYFLRFVANFKGKNFIKSAYQRLGWIALLNNNPEVYKAYMERIKLRGSSEIDGDKQAYSAAGQSSLPDIVLLKARLLFDGGYYQRAATLLEGLQKNDFTSAREKTEYTYRLARIYDDWGFNEKAIQYYQYTLTTGAGKPWYFAANAALHLGLIYERAGNKEKASHFYEKCLAMDFEEYRTSISQKAKAGLNRVK